MTKESYQNFKPLFLSNATNKFFYGALYSKLAEFGAGTAALENSVRVQAGYVKNVDIVRRAQESKDRNLLFIFTEGNKRPADEAITFSEVTG